MVALNEWAVIKSKCRQERLNRLNHFGAPTQGYRMKRAVSLPNTNSNSVIFSSTLLHLLRGVIFASQCVALDIRCQSLYVECQKYIEFIGHTILASKYYLCSQRISILGEAESNNLLNYVEKKWTAEKIQMEKKRGEKNCHEMKLYLNVINSFDFVYYKCLNNSKNKLYSMHFVGYPNL